MKTKPLQKPTILPWIVWFIMTLFLNFVY